MKNRSLKLDDAVFQETEAIVEKLGINQNRYINEAVQYYNQIQKRKLLAGQLKKESRFVRKESMMVLAEFERLEWTDQFSSPQ
jgi:hypothetical protein